MFCLYVGRSLKLGLIQSLTEPCAVGQILAARISQSDWPFKNRAINESKFVYETRSQFRSDGHRQGKSLLR